MHCNSYSLLNKLDIFSPLNSLYFLLLLCLSCLPLSFSISFFLDCALHHIVGKIKQVINLIDIVPNFLQ